MRILCLHGGQQTAEIFENQVNKLCVALGGVATFDFIDAPFLLPLKDERDAVQTRSWCSPDGDYAEADAMLQAHMRGAMASPPPDVLLGFSQGGMVICRYLMHQALSARAPDEKGRLPLPRGVIFAGTPDPRAAFAGSPLLEAFTAQATADGARAEGLFGPLPSLHIVGRKDAIVAPEESRAFCESCGSSFGELLLHEHAHSFPQQQAVIAAVKGFCEALDVSPDAMAALAEMRGMELDMVAAMYEGQCGEDCVRRTREASGGAVVTLPLLTPDDVESGSATTAAVERALVHVSLRFRLSRRYPAVAPELDIVNGPAWHSVAFERWRAETVLRCREYLAEDVGLDTAMILPVHQFACGLALADVEQLKEMLMPYKGVGGEDGAVDGAVRPPLWQEAWAPEDEETRAANIAAAEKEAIALLKKKSPSATGKQPSQQQQQSDGVSEERDSHADGGGMGSPTKSGGGSWTLTVGLIGKPSAGKSTFFNAVTDPQSESEAARVAAFPFTTIEPNVGTGFGGLRCPCNGLLSSSNQSGTDGSDAAGYRGLKPGFSTCDAAYGHVTAKNCPCHRRHPVLVKDVAGLVQGAYQGKGKGNQFLNDLCDADVLVHVVDGAGATDADGSACPAGQGSTLDDISWVRAEVHSWIYDNICAKWSTIRRFPTKLRTMFSGYRSSPVFVDAVLLRLGIANEAQLQARLTSWGPKELHLMVALYIRMRFPMVVALNKADLPTADGLARQLRERYPEELFVPVSAQAEWDLLTLRKKGLVEYLAGSGTFTDLTAGTAGITAAAAAAAEPRVVAKEDVERLRRLHEFFSSAVKPSTREDGAEAGRKAAGRSVGAAASPLDLTSTGVQDVLSEALARCAAVLVFPVSTFDPAIPSLKHCFSFKPGITAEDVFWAMTYARLLDGKLVRFEVVDATAAAANRGVGGAGGAGSAPASASAATAPTILKKMDPLPSKTVFVRVLSNRRQMT